MKIPGWKHRFALATTAGLIGMAMAIGSASTVRANDDKDDEAFDTKLLRQFMHGLGLRQDGAGGIDYRERSPLVVPPSRNLPSPETNSIVDKTAAWPTDPDVKRERDRKAARKKPTRTVEDEGKPELPSQLGPTAKTAPPGQIPTAGPHVDPTKPSSWQELNSKSFFSNITTLGGLVGTRDETAVFTGEPQRGSLTEPPTGYRTPSPTHRYGVGKSKGGAEALNPLDHGSSNTNPTGR